MVACSLNFLFNCTIRKLNYFPFLLQLQIQSFTAQVCELDIEISAAGYFEVGKQLIHGVIMQRLSYNSYIIDVWIFLFTGL